MTSYKRLAQNARPAAILLNRAQRQSMTSAERAHPAHEFGHGALEVGDVLVDAKGGFLLIEAAPEAVVVLRGDVEKLLHAALTLGRQHIPAEIATEAKAEGWAPYLVVLPGSHVHALTHELGLSAETREAPFVPAPDAIKAHAHRHHDHHDCAGHAHEAAGH